MARVYDPTEKPLPEVSADEQDLFRQYGAAMLAGDAKKAERLAQQCLFPPSLTRLFNVAFVELAENHAAAAELDRLQAEAEQHEQALRRLYRLRPNNLAEAEEIDSKIDALQRAGGPLRQKLNSAKSASLRSASISAFLSDLLEPLGSRVVRFPLVAGTRTADLTTELGIDPTPGAWKQLLRPDPRPRRRAWLRAVGR